jgi:hypothetical protein
MKTFHPLSFGLGLGSGLLVLVLIFGAMRIFGGPARGGFPRDSRNFQQMRGANGGPNVGMMAERFGMTEAELQAELDSGKTMQQIAEEHGIELPAGGRGMMQGGGMMTRSSASGAIVTGTGSTTPATSSSSSVSQ